jgi:hypothetical protein
VTLQGGVESMGVLVWQNGAWQKQAQQQVAAAAQGGIVPNAVTGVQVVLAARGFPQPLTKAFLLGSI